MDQIISIYKQFLSFFPGSIHGIVSLVLAVLIVYSIYKVLKHNFIWLILLIILLPASQPILKNIWDSAVNLVKFLLTRG
ncbi:MAG: hypothetical protein KW788_01650 [Candidatus Doudnabacteria bacterium]|nr:hypothetical protein [Candidatus Doudnabacteria bacterium]